MDRLSPAETRYVLVTATGSGHSRGYSEDSMFARLHDLKGSRGPAAGPGRGRSSRVEALRHHRLIYQSAPKRPGQAEPFCMIFEIVPGARLVGRADPGAIVRVSLPVRPRTGRRFNYVSQTQANAEGEYGFSLPYSTESRSRDIETGPVYTVWTGRSSAKVPVPESAVLRGEKIEGPALSE